MQDDSWNPEAQDERFSQLFSGDAVAEIFSELIAYARITSEAISPLWDAPATFQLIRMVEPPEMPGSGGAHPSQPAEAFGFGVEVSEAAEFEDQPFESLLGQTVPSDTIGMLVRCEAWGPPLTDLRAGVEPVLADDGRTELRINLLLLRDGLEAVEIWVRGAGWLSEITEAGHDMESSRVGGRIISAMRCAFGRPSGLSHVGADIEDPAASLAALAHHALLRPVFFLLRESEQAGSIGSDMTLEYIRLLRNVVEDNTGDVNLVSGVLTEWLNDPWADILSGAATWEEVRLRSLAALEDPDVDTAELQAAMHRELRFRTLCPLADLVRWADGEMVQHLFGRDLSNTRLAENPELHEEIKNLDRLGVPEEFVAEFSAFCDLLGERLHEDAVRLAAS
jgi:hypothetical protein